MASEMMHRRWWCVFLVVWVCLSVSWPKVLIANAPPCATRSTYIPVGEVFTLQTLPDESDSLSSSPSARTLLKNAWHELLRTLVQEWTDMNCEITSANNVSGP